MKVRFKSGLFYFGGLMEDIRNNPEFKKCVFQCARRAMLENEYFLKDFLEEVVIKKYNLDDIKRLNVFLKEIFDNDLFDVIMGNKTAEDYKDKYEYKFLKDIEEFSKNVRENAKKKIIKE